MSLKAFYVLITRVRTFGSLRLLQLDEAGIADVAKQRHDEYLHAWEHGYTMMRAAGAPSLRWRHTTRRAG